MPHALRCPRCGEQQQLRGSGRVEQAEEIRVECLACGHSWLRGVQPCVTCGATDVVDRPQTMTRTPRGNQLAVIGTRTIRLCTRCDAGALQASITHNQPVPDGYAARYRHESAAGEEGAGRAVAERPVPPTRQTSSLEPAPASPEPVRSAPSAPPAPRPDGPRQRNAPVTVRQAVAESLGAGVDADPTVVLLLSSRLGTVTRLTEVDHPEVWERVDAWVETTWPDPTAERGRRARQTVAAIVTHWREHGWLTWVRTDSP